MHRKIVVVDGRVAFVGGINFSADHLGDFGPEAKQDYAVRVEGPLVTQIRRFALRADRRRPTGRAPPRRRRRAAQAAAARGDVRARATTTDHRDAIERQYRAAIRAARSEVVIANAYFFPGYRLLKALRRAARRGVKVRLILQGQPDMAIVKRAAELLHAHCCSAGVEIYEYCKRPLHGKVAVIDGDWATVGSSNLDPLSLSLNLEANVMIRDREFAADAARQSRHADVRALHAGSSRTQARSGAPAGACWLDTLAYHFTRHFPAWAGWLPAHAPRLTPPAVAAGARASRERAADGDDGRRRARDRARGRAAARGRRRAAAAPAARAGATLVRAGDRAAVPGARRLAASPTMSRAHRLGRGAAARSPPTRLRRWRPPPRWPPLSHLDLRLYDLLGRRYVGHACRRRRVLGVGFVSYAFNLNLGSLVGGVGFRAAACTTQLGLDAGADRPRDRAQPGHQLVGLAAAGRRRLRGAAGRLPPAVVPGRAGAMQALGVGDARAGAGLRAAVLRARRGASGAGASTASCCRAARLALAQLALSTLNWALIGAVVWLLLPPRVGYGTRAGDAPERRGDRGADARAGRPGRARGGVRRRARRRRCRQRADRRRCWPSARCTTWCRWSWPRRCTC